MKIPELLPLFLLRHPLRVIVLIMFLIGNGTAGSGQNTTEEFLTRNYWVLPMHNLNQMTDSISTDTLSLVRVSERSDFMRASYLSGFKFYEDGDFEELKQYCGEGGRSKEFIGRWTLESDTIIVRIKPNLTWYFDILSLGENEIVAVFRIET